VRDEFSQRTTRNLSARVGYHCSNPTCARSTSGPALSEEGTVNVGVAAHITAASLGGPRYDATLTPAERSAAANGIWLCQICHKLIDDDEDRHTVAMLHQWKRDALERATCAIAAGRPLGAVVAPSALDDADQEFLRGLDLPSNDAADVVCGHLRVAARSDISTFQAEAGRPTRTVTPTLSMVTSDVPNIELNGVARLAALAEPVSIVAAGGMGKSTALLQLAECLLAEDGQVPLLVPLGEWSDREDDFFDFVLRRNVFGRFRRQHLMQLGYYGRLVLLLDGWNELTPEARLRATRDVKVLRREYPLLGLIVSARNQSLPVTGPIVAIGTLAEDQQLELARALRGEDGEAILDQAWRSPGVRELVGIPLYLNALLTLPLGVSFPETKEAVLHMFVQGNESSPERMESLRRDTLGQHKAMLVGLAVEANRAANTVISDSNAKRTISKVLQYLSEDGQISTAPQPPAIVDALVSAHLLVRTAGAGGAVSFQHQLFQEWYATTEVEDLMSRAAAGDARAHKRLREEILNLPSWEESILFACDRLSRSSKAGETAVAAAIEDSFGIDPMLAGVMLDRAAGGVWLLLRERVLSFVVRWHTPNKFDRALRFIVASGKPEFADLIWPLATSVDDQVQLATLRAFDRFRPSVLGPNCEALLRDLPVPQRLIALSEIASNSGSDGMELAARIAMGDPDPNVVASVVTSLAFRRGDRHVNRIMRVAPDTVWKTLAKESYPDHLTDPQLNSRLAVERAAARAGETDPIRLLHRIAYEKPADAEARLIAVLANAELDFKQASAEHAIAQAFLTYPTAVASGLVTRIANDLSLPFGVCAYLKQAPQIDSGPIARAALDPSTARPRLNAAAAILGPTTSSALFDQLLAMYDEMQSIGRYDKRLADTRFRLSGAIALTRQDVFLPVLVARSKTDSPERIAAMADLLARHGNTNGRTKRPIAMADLKALCDMLEQWITTLLAMPKPVRHASSEVARAAERVANSNLAEPLRRLLERDLTDYATARAAYLAAPRGPMPPDASVVYSRTYARAFTAMRDQAAVAVLTRDLSDLRWGIDAAAALYEIWSAENPSNENRVFSGWSDFSQHLSRRKERSKVTPATSDFAESIFGVVRVLGDAAKSDGAQQHALALAAIGLGLPHGCKRSEIAALLALPPPIAGKQRLLSAAARAGEIVSASQLMDGLRDLLSAAQTQAWRLEENHGELMGWIELFPFSDDPESVFDAIALLPEQRRQPHALTRLLQALAQSPGESALRVLKQLAANNPAFFQQYEWQNALVNLDAESAAIAVLDGIGDGRIPVGDSFRLSRALADWAGKYATVRNAIIARYRALPPDSIRRVLEMAMGDLVDEEVFMALFEGYLHAPGSALSLGTSIRNMAIGKRPSDQWREAFVEFGVPLTGLRARLFAMLPTHDARALLAKQILIAIEEHRDDRGRPNDEPRHPDIGSGRAWPPEAAELANLAS
jgi:hypothetical protein